MVQKAINFMSIWILRPLLLAAPQTQSSQDQALIHFLLT
jgi:hypothetical protein